MDKSKQYMQAAKHLMLCEAEALNSAVQRLDKNFEDAVEIILKHKGKLMICGVGKSGLVGQKLAATFSSTGTPAVFMHAAEAVHGDLGIYEPGDPTILISKSGATLECMRVMPVLKKFNSKLIVIVGNVDSPMARLADVVIDASVACEGDPLGLVPTSSSTLALAMGDAIACSLMSARGFKKEDFAIRHPAGQLGKNLTMNVEDVMHKESECAFIPPTSTLRESVIAMTQKPLGAACIIDENKKLLGIITDGDIRRLLQQHIELDTVTAAEIMTKNPIKVSPEASLAEAVKLMEERKSKLSVLPIVDADNRALGIIRLHDIYQPNT